VCCFEGELIRIKFGKSVPLRKNVRNVLNQNAQGRQEAESDVLNHISWFINLLFDPIFLSH
jgi:hypothetical protein